jgi:methyl coenzyme M reductase subunit D
MKLGTEDAVVAPVTVHGRRLWKRVEVGPRGGHKALYAERREGEVTPSGWALWSETARDAGGFASPAGTFAHGGLGR